MNNKSIQWFLANESYLVVGFVVELSIEVGLTQSLTFRNFVVVCELSDAKPSSISKTRVFDQQYHVI